MFQSLGRAITVLALCCAIGLQWIALQSVAWTTMIVEYSKCAPLGKAIAQTFDGAHPCSLCHVVNNGKNSEKKSELQSAAPKIDIICTARSVQLVRPARPFEYTTTDSLFSNFSHSPPAPPPRCFLS